MIRFVYNLLWPIGLLFFLPGYLLKMFRRGGYREKFGQRLGLYDADVRQRLGQRKSIWLHAVSVGEVGVALKLAAEMRALQPDLHGVLTTTTTTGFSFANKNAPSWIEAMYNPLDFWPIMRRAFAVIRPAKIVLIESEIWPNLVAEAHSREIPVVLANARLSPRSERKFHRFRRFVRPTFGLLDLVCVPEPEDIDRWSALGIDRGRICHTGSIKYDSEKVDVDPSLPQKVLRDLKIDNPEIIGPREHFRSRPIIFGGSTHRGKEEILADIFCELRAQFPGLALVVAPRQAERAGEVRRVLEQLGLRVIRRSESAAVEGTVDCLLVDSTGELQNWYAVATVAFVGKSLGAHGGQNPVEPIMAGVPVVFGPNMENFRALTHSLVQAGAALQVGSPAELKKSIADLLCDPDRRTQLVKKARAVLQAHRGATARTAHLIADLKSER